ncbi:MAG: hypothetical protein BRC25_03655 [Parcubacteria group bacterium SW_6_46_9]|nr:MAG: hypothetical protein BRC25_03655 [Parcubacteria group bacterium SW_6_46_9]
MQRHSKKVKLVQKQINKFRKADKKAGVDHGSSNSTRSNKEKLDSINTKDLDEVIEVNENKEEVTAEPNVSMRELVSATIDHGLIPSVVPEFPAITVGGAIQGGAGESGSFSHGLFHETTKEIEIITGDGARMSASRQKNQDLFFGSACSYGSLGILTQAKIKLIPAKQFVHLTYHHVDGFAHAIEKSKRLSKKNPDFVDGIMYEESGVIMEANLSNDKDLPQTTFQNKEDEWFYLHVKNNALNNDGYEELVPIQDYFFRYDRGAFWTGKHVFDLLHLPFRKSLRSILDRGFRTENMYELLHVTDLSQKYIIQDICLPEESAVEFMQYIQKKHNISPQWVLPIEPDTDANPTVLY